MEEENTTIRLKIAELKARYTRLALNCKTAGIKVNPETVNAYMKELQKLEEESIKALGL